MEQGFVRVRYTGAGLMLIKREVFEQLKDRFPRIVVQHLTPKRRPT